MRMIIILCFPHECVVAEGISSFVRIRTTQVIIRTPYIPLDKLYIIDESIRQITIILFIINCINNLIIYLFLLFFYLIIQFKYLNNKM